MRPSARTSFCGPVRPLAVLVVLALLAPVAEGASGTDRPPAPTEVRGAEISAPVTPFVFEGDVRDLPAPPRWQPGDPIKEIPRRFYPEPGVEAAAEPTTGVDPLLRRQLETASAGIAAFTSPTRNFPGQGFSGVNPPDTVGEVGPDHYIQMINAGGGATVAIYDKAEPIPTLIASFVLDNLGSGVCAGGYGDPIVLHDRLAGRWLLSEFSSSGNNLCVYISKTGDPVTGGWYAYGFTAPSFPDYPKYGVWPTDANGGAGSYIVTANDGGPGIYALDRGAMLAGTAGTYQRVSIPGLPGFGFEAPTPADLDGPQAPPAGAPAVIMRHRDTESHSGPPAVGDLLEMWSFDVDWIDPAASTLTPEPSIDVADFDSNLCGLTSFSCFRQPGSSVQLDPLREVIMNRLQYMSHGERETLVGNFVVDVDATDHGGIRWFELTRAGGGGWTLKQEGTYSIDGDSRWMGSSAMDQSGNIAVAYNVSSTSTYPSLRYTGRLVGDPLGVMTQAESVIHAGAASNASNRYGDYAAMNLDPADDCTFWFTGMDNTSSSWRTQIASFRFDACGCDLVPEPPTVSAIDNGDNRIDVSWTDSELPTITQYLVRRSRTPGGPYQTVAVVPDDSPGVGGGPGHDWSDLDVSGGITYHYVVLASDGEACESDPLNEVSATATGPCTLPPLFDGLQTVSTSYDAVCTLELTWNAGLAECAGPLRYDVHRSLDPDFVPGPENLLVPGLSATTWTDLDSLASGEPYHYVVRARDLSNGVAETNAHVVAERPFGERVPGTWTDDAGDTGPAQLVPSSPWQIGATEGFNGPAVYKTGGYGNGVCAGLVTPELLLGAGSVMTFYARYDIETSWDKGEVQISTDGGNSWQRVPVDYPGTSTHAADACGLPTGSYFTGTNQSWGLYTANLGAWSNQAVRIRFVLSTDSSVSRSGWWIDDIAISQVQVPGECTTGSPCPDNPIVDVRPDGPLATCSGTQILSAETVGGTGPFAYQWIRDGIDVPGANEETFLPDDVGVHNYNCKVRAATCSIDVLDPSPTRIDAGDRPLFDGLGAVSDAQGQECSLTLQWSPAATPCAGPLSYWVFRDTAPAVAVAQETLVASNVTETTWTDRGALIDGVAYHYRVQAFDRSTRRFDGNAVEGSASPTGSGTGLQRLLDEPFEGAGAIAAWTTSVVPGSRTCGLWTTSDLQPPRPAGGAGLYAISDGTSCGNQRTSTALESPPIDVTLPGVVGVSLEVDLYFEQAGGDDTVSIQAWDGTQWQTVWSDPGATVDTRLTLDVTPWAAANPAFRVRFDYQSIDRWLSVDNIAVIVEAVNECATAVGPPSVSAGGPAGQPLRARRADASGGAIELSWDTSVCAAADYNLIFGDLAGVSSYVLDGSACGLGSSGGAVWSEVPPGNLYFLVVGTDGAGTESSWGRDGDFGERNGPVASGLCGVATKNTSASCP